MTKLKKFKRGFIFGMVLGLILNVTMFFIGEKTQFNGFIDLTIIIILGIFYGLIALTKWSKYFMDSKYLEKD